MPPMNKKFGENGSIVLLPKYDFNILMNDSLRNSYGVLRNIMNVTDPDEHMKDAIFGSLSYA